MFTRIFFDEQAGFISLSSYLEESCYLSSRCPQVTYWQGDVPVPLLPVRPIFNADGTCFFDRKIGIWPLVKQLMALKNTTNKEMGTLVAETVNVD